MLELMRRWAASNRRVATIWRTGSFLRYERRNHVRLPLRDTIRALRLGFSTRSYALYALRGRDPSEYLSDLARVRYGSFVNAGPLGEIVQNKLWFYLCTQDIVPCQPRVFGLIAKGRFQRLRLPAGLNSQQGGGDGHAVVPLLQEQGKVILKPLCGNQGTGVRLLTASENGYTVNGLALDEHELTRRIARLDRYLVVEYVEQHAYAHAIFPGAVNTLRLVTLWDDEEHEPFLATAVHRFGTTQSAPADNVARGGLAAPIDAETGILGIAGLIKLRSPTPVFYTHHPETKVAIAGTRVPHWQAIKAAALSAARSVPSVPYVGWDIAVTKTDPGMTFIEGNDGTGIDLLQMHEPLLRSPRVVAFFRHHGVI